METNKNFLQRNRNLLLDNRNLLLDKRNLILRNKNLLLSKQNLLLSKRNLLQRKRNLLQSNRNLLQRKRNLLETKRYFFVKNENRLERNRVVRLGGGIGYVGRQVGDYAIFFFLGDFWLPLRKVVYMIAKFIQLVQCNLSCFGGINRFRGVSEPEPVGGG